MAKIEDITISLLQFGEDASPATPDTGKVIIYAKTDGLLYSKDDAGTETCLGSAAEVFTAAVHATTDHSGITGVPSISGLLDETAHDALDHTGLTGVIDAYSKTEMGAVADGSAGADQVGMTAITETGAAATVQAVIEALITRLKATADSASGADLIGATEITGLAGLTTVQAILEALASGGGSGASAFTDLTDTPSTYTGQGGKVVAVKSDVSGLEFITAPTGGSSGDGIGGMLYLYNYAWGGF